MRNFLKIASGIDVGPLLLAVSRQPELWNRDRVRTSHPLSAHRVVDDILLRYNAYQEGEDFVEKVCADLTAVEYPAWNALPQAKQLVMALMARVEGLHLGRVMISRLAPGVMIPLHSDRIPPAEEAFPGRIPPAVYYDRYHIVLQSAPGAVFQCGGESVYMAPSEAWWFNNQIPHDVTNNSAEDRIHLIADIHSGISAW